MDRLRLIVARKAVWPDERDDVLMAAQALGVDPADSDVDHPLADLYRVLHLSAVSNGMLYLSREHCRLLLEATNRLEEPKRR